MWSVLAQTSSSENDLSVEVTESCGDLGPLCDQIAQWTGNEEVASTVAWVLSTPVKVVIIAVVALLLNRMARKAVTRSVERLGSASEDASVRLMSERTRVRAGQRADTIGSLVRSLVTVLVYGIAGLMILDLVGISIVPVIASAGILGLAFGFGAQSVVEDMLRGVFMLAEDQFGVGDRIDVGSVNGYVERVTLRTTVVKDPNGVVWHVPNSQIDYVANETQESSRAVVEVPLDYGTDIDRAITALQSAAESACADPAWVSRILSEPEVRGVQDLQYDNFSIRVQVWVEPSNKRQFERHLRKHLKEGLEAANVSHPNRGLDVWVHGTSAA